MQEPDPPARVPSSSAARPSRTDHAATWPTSANLETLRHTAIVCTWVNGTENCYNKRRQRARLPAGSSSRDKEMDELKYSLHLLLKFVPGLEGPIYIASDWLGTSNPLARRGPGRPAVQLAAHAHQGQHRGLAQERVREGVEPGVRLAETLPPPGRVRPRQ
ncbi:hypothetical protein PF003_g13990 [Phytophthora fragariae]|nr:hypothetical protein PF003_g13990 [Phytophthora fragariae]